MNKRFLPICFTAVCLCILLFMLSDLQAVKEDKKTPIAAGVEAEDGIKKIAITFDDGPHPIYTIELLDGLKERGVHATFFLIGKSAEQNPEIVKRMYEDGHQIGNHTYSHANLNALNLEAACAEVTKTNDIIAGITGESPTFLRPPFGEWDKKEECPAEMLSMFWNIDTRDWCSTDIKKIVKAAVSKAGDGGIILMHDVYATSVEAALMIVDELQALGYEFVTADEMILD